MKRNDRSSIDYPSKGHLISGDGRTKLGALTGPFLENTHTHCPPSVLLCLCTALGECTAHFVPHLPPSSGTAAGYNSNHRLQKDDTLAGACKGSGESIV